MTNAQTLRHCLEHFAWLQCQGWQYSRESLLSEALDQLIEYAVALRQLAKVLKLSGLPETRSTLLDEFEKLARWESQVELPAEIRL
jgi:hypothetical protein